MPVRRLLPALLALAALAAPTTAQAGPGETIAGTVTITGTAGKDAFELRISGSGPPAPMTISPAVNITGTIGGCSPDIDPQTGRPSRNRCNAGNITNLILNLGGGDDNVAISDGAGVIASSTANAGLGNDTIVLSIQGGRTLNGNEGDDKLRISGLQGTAVTTFDGGVGRDFAAYGSISSSSGSVPMGISGNLATNQVILKRHEPGGGTANQRTDTLIGIEGLEGSEEGDVLTGGPGANTELIGGEGPDNITAGTGNTVIDGGDGLDNVSGGAGVDLIDGGLGIDSFRGGTRDTYVMRDGYAETVDCSGGNTVINDLADAITNAANCTSVQTAAAKHKHDTTILQRRLKIAPNGATLVRLKCPLRKREPCVGKLRLKAGRKTLASANYLILQGTSKLLRFRLNRRQARLATFGKVEILGEETDDDGRPRAILRRVPAQRKPA